jgi:hypothetical protein
MRHIPILTVMILAAGLLGTSCSPSPKEDAARSEGGDEGRRDYEIKLARPEKAGNEFHMAAVSHQSITTTLKGGSDPADQEVDESTVELDAAVKVLEVDKNGTPSKLTLTVEKGTGKKGAAPAATLLSEGTVVTAGLRDGKPVFEVGGRPVRPDVADALGLVVLLGDGQATDDDAFGTTHRKKVGDEWPIDAAVAAKIAAKSNVIIAKENIKGAVRLAKVEKVGETDCLHIQAQAVATQFTPPLPAGVTFDQGTFEARLAGKYPVGASARPLERSTEITMKVFSRSKPDPRTPELAIDTTLKETLTVKYGPPKK